LVRQRQFTVCLHVINRDADYRSVKLCGHRLCFKRPASQFILGGDSGYNTHFADNGKRFGKIDLAVLENGQYNENWKDIHTSPKELVKAAKDLKAKRRFTVHNSKYALAHHSWKEPLENIANANKKDSLNLITPMIGEPVYLNDTAQIFTEWWKTVRE
jgi:L-ascorbate metabolism protein UlaG (beta-lactamase superfamily)